MRNVITENTLEGIPLEKALAHRDACAFCQKQLKLGTAESKWQIIRHILISCKP